MGAFVIIIPRSILTLNQEDSIIHEDYDDDENPLFPAMVEQDTSSVTDSVDLLIERCPLLFTPHIEGDDEAEEGSDSKYDVNDDNSYIEFDVPLNDNSIEEKGAPSRTAVPRRRRRFPSALDYDASDRVCHDGTYEDCGDFPFDHEDYDEEDSIDFHSFQERPQPLSRALVPPATTF
ncbi:MAG: hypothetical protein SGBAC_008356 [Bacillariaceae sp.]